MCVNGISKLVKVHLNWYAYLHLIKYYKRPRRISKSVNLIILGTRVSKNSLMLCASSEFESMFRLKNIKTI
jgi:hypothetical protein